MGSSLFLMFHDVTSEFYPFSGFQTIGASEYEISENKFVEILELESTIPRNIIFTFDDGGSSFYNVIAPLLERFNKRGVFFISTNFIGKEGFLTMEQIKSLHSRGHLIASHSHTHPDNISKLSEDEILNEWINSRKILENIVGEEIRRASIPQGAVSKKVLKLLNKAGYTEIWTSIPSTTINNFEEMDVYGRYAVTNNMDIVQIDKILSSESFRKSLYIRYWILNFCKIILGSNYSRLKKKILQFKK